MSVARELNAYDSLEMSNYVRTVVVQYYMHAQMLLYHIADLMLSLFRLIGMFFRGVVYFKWNL